MALLAGRKDPLFKALSDWKLSGFFKKNNDDEEGDTEIQTKKTPTSFKN